MFILCSSANFGTSFWIVNVATSQLLQWNSSLVMGSCSDEQYVCVQWYVNMIDILKMCFIFWFSLTLQALLDYERFKTGIPVPGSSQRGGQIDGPYLGDNQGTVSPATPSSQVWIYATSKWANPLAPFITSFCRRLSTQCCVSPLWVARDMHFQGPWIFV